MSQTDGVQLKAESSKRRMWRRFRSNRTAVAGSLVLLVLILVAVFADAISPTQYDTVSRNRLTAPSLAYPLGTDDLGKDVLSGVIYGSRISLVIGFSSAFLATLIGVTLGLISGFYGGRIDDLLMRFTEAVLIIPRFFLVLMVIAVVGTNTMLLIAIIGLTSWPSSARLLRAEILSLRELEFVESARAMGSSNARIMVRHLLPNALHPVVVNGTLGIASAILLEAGLSFLGLGDPSVVSWGQMLQNAQQYFTRAWWMSVFPGAAIFVTVLAFNLVGDGLNDVLNPKITD